MRKSLLAAALSVLLLLAGAATATATITSPARGGSVTESGSLTYLDTIVRVTCDVALSGTVLTSTSVNIASGLTTPCTIPAANFVMTPTFTWTQTLDSAAGTFVISNVQIRTQTFTVPTTCIFQGSLSGTYTRTANSVWTITGDAMVRQPGSSAVCSTNPTFTGSLNTNMTIV